MTGNSTGNEDIYLNSVKACLTEETTGLILTVGLAGGIETI
jgi:hypothetical protein